MPASPMSNGVLSVQIKVEGSPISDKFIIVAATVNRALNEVSSANIQLLEDLDTNPDLEGSNSDVFVPGKAIQIMAGYDGHSHALFEGVISKHRLKTSGEGKLILEVSCLDKAFIMTKSAKNRVFESLADHDICKKVIENNGLTLTMSDTSFIHPKMVQYYSTDWDFIAARAKVNGMVIANTDGAIAINKPNIEQEANLAITFRYDAFGFDLELNGNAQLQEVNAKSWNNQSQEVLNQKSTEPAVNAQGNITGLEMANTSGKVELQLQTNAPLANEQLQTWSNGTLLYNRMARIQGSVTFQGSELAYPDTLIELKSFGERFDGQAYVSGVRHEMKEGKWITTAQIGLTPSVHPEIASTRLMASGLVPGVSGLQIGVVKQINNDPSGNMRVLVQMPLLESITHIWARISNVYATQNAGSFFMPELEDEVILGFLNNDPRNPIVLGSLYNQQSVPPVQPDGNNSMKGIFTKSNLKLTFDDDQKVITLETPDGNKLNLSEHDKSVVLQDQHQNEIKLDQDGITINSKKDLKLNAPGAISIEGNSIALAAKAEISLKGVTINNTAQSSFSAKGNASAELIASGQTTVKGAMVMIN